MHATAEWHNLPGRQRGAAVLGVAAALLGALGLLGWALGLPRLTSVVPGYKAIAPSIALALLVLGLALARQASARIGRRERSAAVLVLGLVSLAGLLEVIGTPIHADLNLEDAATAGLARALNIPFTPMSPVAGLLLLLLGPAMLALHFLPGAEPRARLLGEGVGAVATFSAAIAFVFVLGYGYRTPLLYGSGAIPIAATAALGFLLVSVGLVLSVGPRYWPLRALSGASARARLMRAFVPFTVLAVIISSLASDFRAGFSRVNHALLDALLVTVCVIVATIVACRLARGLGEAIERAQAAQQAAERARAQLAQTLQHEVAHRVKNNLSMVAALLQMQADRLPAGGGESRALREAIARVYAFSSLHELISEAGGQEVDITAAIRRIVATTQQVLEATGVEISVVGDPAPYPIKAATNLCAIANELLTNAIKHGRPGPDGSTRVVVTLSREGQQVMLSVWNSGSPIPPGFEPTTRRTVGLRLVSEIVASHYGGLFTLAPSEGGALAKVLLDDTRLREET
jgi:two-component sensor histidine kinase